MRDDHEAVGDDEGNSDSTWVLLMFVEMTSMSNVRGPDESNEARPCSEKSGQQASCATTAFATPLQCSSDHTV